MHSNGRGRQVPGSHVRPQAQAACDGVAQRGHAVQASACARAGAPSDNATAPRPGQTRAYTAAAEGPRVRRPRPLQDLLALHLPHMYHGRSSKSMQHQNRTHMPKQNRSRQSQKPEDESVANVEATPIPTVGQSVDWLPPPSSAHASPYSHAPRQCVDHAEPVPRHIYIDIRSPCVHARLSECAATSDRAARGGHNDARGERVQVVLNTHPQHTQHRQHPVQPAALPCAGARSDCTHGCSTLHM